MNAEEIRNQLINKHAYTPDEVSEIKGIAALRKELEDANKSLEYELEQSDVEFEPETESVVHSTVSDRPDYCSSEWSDYVLSQFRPDELDREGNPRCNGLRRLVNELIGPIIYSAPKKVFPPDERGCATVQYEIHVVWSLDVLGRYTDLSEELPRRIFGGAADCHPGNTQLTYSRHATATADSKAESRALRRALGLNVITSEEAISSEEEEEEQPNGVITPQQITFIKVKCHQLNIDPFKFINKKHFTNGEELQYQKIEDIDKTTALSMLKELNRYQMTEEKDIPNEILN